MNTYRKQQLKNQFQFTTPILWLISIGLVIWLILGNHFSLKSPLMWLTLITVALTIVHHYMMRLINKDQFESSTFRNLSVLLILGVLTGNIFTLASGLYGVKGRITSGYKYAVYMVIVDIVVILVSLLNVFKPFVSDYFVIGMGILAVILAFHIYILLVGGDFENFSKAKQKTIQVLLWISVLSGNLLAAFVAVSLNLASDKEAHLRRPTSVVEKLTRNAAALLSLAFIAFLVMISVTSYLTFAETFAVDNNYQMILQVPSLVFPFGTDNFGRDVFSRVILGARISFFVGVLSTIIPFFIGGALGAISGYFGDAIDNITMRILDVVYAIPGLILAITIVAAFGNSVSNLIIALSIGAIPAYARTMRADVMQVVNYEYVESAYALGESDWNILKKHVIPNSMSSMIVRATLTIGTAVIATSSLSFLGLGVAPHIPEWGNILQTGSNFLETDPHLAIFPGLAIMFLVLAFNFLGDGLRDATDPKTN